MAAKTAIVIASALALTPAVATFVWPDREAADATVRSVELSGPIQSFNQTRQHIQVRLVPAVGAEQRSQVVVRDAAGASLSIPLKRGQTWASAKLPEDLASANALQISVE
jgi:hypothetical protein